VIQLFFATVFPCILSKGGTIYTVEGSLVFFSQAGKRCDLNTTLAEDCLLLESVRGGTSFWQVDSRRDRRPSSFVRLLDLAFT
jgi:hypothetical protein